MHGGCCLSVWVVTATPLARHQWVDSDADAAASLELISFFRPQSRMVSMSSAETSSYSLLCQKEILYHGMLCITAITVVVAQARMHNQYRNRYILNMITKNNPRRKSHLFNVSGDSSQLLHYRVLPGQHASCKENAEICTYHNRLCKPAMQCRNCFRDSDSCSDIYYYCM